MPNIHAHAPHVPPRSAGLVAHVAAADWNPFIGQRVGEADHPGPASPQADRGRALDALARLGVGRPARSPSGGGGLSNSEDLRDCADENPVSIRAHGLGCHMTAPASRRQRRPATLGSLCHFCCTRRACWLRKMLDLGACIQH